MYQSFQNAGAVALLGAIALLMLAIACSAPTPTPLPTATPAPTATPLPTPTPTPDPHTGIGVTREAVESRFSILLDFKFEGSRLNDGTYRTLASEGDALVELIGPSENLSEAALVLSFPVAPTSYNRDAFLTAIVHYTLFLEEVFPEWPDADDWVTTSIGELGGDGERSTTHGDKRVKVTDLRESFGVFSIIVEPKDS